MYTALKNAELKMKVNILHAQIKYNNYASYYTYETVSYTHLDVYKRQVITVL